MSQTKKQEMEPITSKAILESLDSSIEGDYCDFIDLGHGYFELANCRITLFKNGDKWAMVFEKIGYNARAGQPVSIEISYFGNCLVDLPEYNNQLSNIIFIDVDNNIYDALKNGSDTIEIRNQKIAIPKEVDSYKKHGIDWEFEGGNYEGAVLKYLAETHPDLTRATEDEIRTCLPKDLVKIFTLDNWYQEIYHQFEPTHPPSTQVTFQMIAKVLETGDTNYYKAVKKPNTHWSNWLESGKL